MESFFKEYVDMWKRWSDFSGKSNVKEFWMAWLINFIVSSIIGAIGITVLTSVYPLAVLIPSLALAIRRMHDVGKSGWYLLWFFLPIIGWIMVIIALAKQSQ
jgi:uncharacterized membrane protein YhaH (DUF805 family)